MTPSLLNAIAITPALALLPARMDTRQARVFLLAIAMQESDSLRYRRQVGGPARGFWQAEEHGGYAGVLRHRATSIYAVMVCDELVYSPPTPATVYAAVEHNDVLAAAFARLLLWTLPQRLPGDAEAAWSQYLEAWRPGKPHHETWATHWAQAQAALP